MKRIALRIKTTKMSDIAIPAEDTASEGSPEKKRAPKLSLGVQVFQNTAAQLAGRVIGIFLSAGTSILLARYLGKEKLGEYGAIYAYLSLYAFFATFCLEQILAREISVRRHQGAELFHTATVTALGFSIVGAVIAPLLAPLFGYSGMIRWLIAIAAVDMLILPPLRFGGIIFQVELQLWYNVVIGLIRQALWLAAVVLLALKHAAFYEVIIARTMVGVLEAVVVVWNVRRVNLVRGTRRFISEDARMMLKSGLPLVVASLAAGVFLRIDQVMLHKMSGDVVLGPYVIAVQLTELFSALPIALMVSFFPAFAESAADGERFSRYLGEAYRFLLVVVFAACALLSPIAHPAIRAIYGPEFASTAGLLVVLIWSEVPIFFTAVLNNALIAKNLQRHSPVPAIVGAVLNVLLNLWAIPRYGALGASWATVVSYCSGVAYLMFVPKVRPLVMSGLVTAIKPLVLTLGITAALALLPLAFWWKFILAAAAYGLGAWAWGVVTQNDLDRLRSMIAGGMFRRARG